MLCDVDAAFYGENGAAYVFAPQKGADDDGVHSLDDGLRSFAAVLQDVSGVDVQTLKYAGAAGGIAGGLCAVLGAKAVCGIDAVLGTIGFDGIIAGLYEYYASYKPYFESKLKFIPFPIDLSTVTPKTATPHERVRFFIGIQKSRSQYKGTDIMLRALERVVGEYPEKAEMIKVESVPFEKYQNLMNSSDVILDQLYSYTPAMNALVAMAKGLVVVGGGEEENYEILGEKELRPIINVLPNEESVYNELKNLVIHSERIPELSRQSVEYIHKYHDADKVAQQYVNFWLQRIDAKIKAKNDPALQLD